MKKTAENADVKMVLAVSQVLGKSYLFKKEWDKDKVKIITYQLIPDEKFLKTKNNFVIRDIAEKSVSLEKLNFLSITAFGKKFSGIFGFEDIFYVGISSNGFAWELKERISKRIGSAYIVPDYSFNNKRVLYWSDDSIHIGFSNDSTSWTLYDDPIYTYDYGNQKLAEILGVFSGHDSLFVPFGS